MSEPRRTDDATGNTGDRRQSLDPNVSPLRQALDDAMANGDAKSMKDLTVLSPQVDPFRFDTPANHRIGQWLADAAATLGLLDGDRQIHLRGMHYAIGQAETPFIKPDGTRYLNNDDNWHWLSGDAAKAARWLGYIPFDKIFDKRNDSPTVRIFKPKTPTPYLSVGIEVNIPDADDLAPEVEIDDYAGAQPYKIVMVGEKSSLDEGLTPIAAEHGADLYLLKGSISDTFVYQIAKIGAADGRPMMVLYFSDCDPSGWNMPIEVGRKLQAFKVGLFPDLEFRCYRALLTPDQTRTLGLPSAPLKRHPNDPTKYADKRANEWIEMMRVEQVEIDALTTPRKVRTLRRLAREAIRPFFDYTLTDRVEQVKREWVERAQAAVDANVDQDHLDRVRTEAEAKLTELRTEIEAINNALRVDITDFPVPDVPGVPAPVLDEEQPLPLIDSEMPFAEQCERLIDSKRYRDDADG